MFCEVPVGNALGFGSGADPLCLYFFGNFTDFESIFDMCVAGSPFLEFFLDDSWGVFGAPASLSSFAQGAVLFEV